LLWSTVDNGDNAVSKVATDVRRSAVCVRFQTNLNFLGDIIVKNRNIKFHENPSSGNQVVPYDGRTDSILIVAFRNFLTALKMWLIMLLRYIWFVFFCTIKKNYVINISYLTLLFSLFCFY